VICRVRRFRGNVPHPYARVWAHPASQRFIRSPQADSSNVVPRLGCPADAGPNSLTLTDVGVVGPVVAVQQAVGLEGGLGW
jgi:hypothetical protein